MITSISPFVSVVYAPDYDMINFTNYLAIQEMLLMYQTFETVYYPEEEQLFFDILQCLWSGMTDQQMLYANKAAEVWYKKHYTTFGERINVDSISTTT